MSELGAIDVLVVGGTGVDHIVRVPLLPLAVRDSMTIPPIQSVVVSHPSGTRRAVNLVAPDGSRMSLYDPRPPVDRPVTGRCGATASGEPGTST